VGACVGHIPLRRQARLGRSQTPLGNVLEAKLGSFSVVFSQLAALVRLTRRPRAVSGKPARAKRVDSTIAAEDHSSVSSRGCQWGDGRPDFSGGLAGANGKDLGHLPRGPFLFLTTSLARKLDGGAGCGRQSMRTAAMAGRKAGARTRSKDVRESVPRRRPTGEVRSVRLGGVLGRPARRLSSMRKAGRRPATMIAGRVRPGSAEGADDGMGECS